MALREQPEEKRIILQRHAQQCELRKRKLSTTCSQQFGSDTTSPLAAPAKRRRLDSITWAYGPELPPAEPRPADPVARMLSQESPGPSPRQTPPRVFRAGDPAEGCVRSVVARLFRGAVPDGAQRSRPPPVITHIAKALP